jgi:histidine triad (HIT) family protein
MTTIFEKILNKEIPCQPIYEDDHTLAFHDIAPQAPVHILIIPKKKFVNVNDLNDEDAEAVGKVLVAAKKIAQKLDLDKKGYRLVFNNGEGAGQTVFYMHCHLLAGRSLSWPPG